MTLLSNLTDTELSELDIQADLYCSQGALNCDEGDSQFNLDTYPDLMGDDYADAILAGLWSVRT